MHVKLEKVKEIAVRLSSLSDPENCGHDEAWYPHRQKSLVERSRKKIQDRYDKQKAQKVRHFKARHLELLLKARANLG